MILLPIVQKYFHLVISLRQLYLESPKPQSFYFYTNIHTNINKMFPLLTFSQKLTTPKLLIFLTGFMTRFWIPNLPNECYFPIPLQILPLKSYFYIFVYLLHYCISCYHWSLSKKVAKICGQVYTLFLTSPSQLVL